jgi:hypothetical protein
MILDFRFSEGVIKDTESERVRDYRHQMKLKLGHGSIPDGPHAIIGSTDHSSSAMVDSHKELYPNTELCQTTSVEDAWNAVMGAIQMPEPIRVFFK